ncbi:predicted protein [Plenodomus lingam JN3]|uniref:Predicted protein n=1 Tax=Leptosphaeria maculans (strain JN3 / isolate v23.1.3 / race Av1-4-5-6-7-8) TaxID=985895 RepID=E4ZPT3_LEPMJ|nr:predicted protein [Plenodomus lingam JN3]CBX93468.1 predicted protein [Plenodomus lingam JN3]
MLALDIFWNSLILWGSPMILWKSLTLLKQHTDRARTTSVNFRC